MKVLIRLKAESQRIELEAKNAYSKNGCFCVYREDETVRKFPLANLFDVEIRPGELEARSTPSLMNVSIHLIGTLAPIKLQPDRTSHDGEMFVATMPSSAIKMYPMSNIAYIDEDYTAKPAAQTHDSGPLETLVDKSTGAYFKRMGATIDKKLAEGDGPKGCTKRELIRLCSHIGDFRGRDDLTDYRSLRALGFCVGVLRHHNINLELEEVQWVNGSGDTLEEQCMAIYMRRYKDLADHQIRQIGTIIPDYTNPESGPDLQSEHYALALCNKFLEESGQWSMGSQCFSLGVAQGLLAASGVIQDIDKEVMEAEDLMLLLQSGKREEARRQAKIENA